MSEENKVIYSVLKFAYNPVQFLYLTGLINIQINKNNLLKFSSLSFSEPIQKGLQDTGFEEATPIQAESLPLTLEGKDIVGLARTGSGKTAAFLLPILQKIEEQPKEGIQALIISPTRELASQIDDEIFALGYHCDASSALIIGGSDFSAQSKAIRNDVSMLVATPGRLIDQIKLMDIDFSNIDFLVLDEADRMLDMGFMPDVRKIISYLPEKRQTLLFSATMPGEIKKLVSEFMNEPEFIEVEASKPAESVDQYYYQISDRKKIDLFEHLLEKEGWDSVIVFTARKRSADILAKKLTKRSIEAVAIHGDLEQDERENALHAFSHGNKKVIAATDVLARGIDIKEVKAIINYDVPRTSDDYIHRIGRTGRYDKEGTAVTFVCPRDKKTFRSITSDLDNKIIEKQLPESGNSSNNNQKAEKKERRRETPKQQTQQKSTGTSAPANRKSRQKSSDETAKARSKSKTKKSNRRPDTEEQKRKKPDRRENSEPEEKLDSIVDYYEGNTNSELLKNVPKIEEATRRKAKKWKPAKGYWGVVKSMLPRL